MQCLLIEKKIKEIELSRAKGIAGRFYECCLEEYFMVLKDDSLNTDTERVASGFTSTVDDGQVLTSDGTAQRMVTTSKQTLANVLKRKLSENSDSSKRKK